MNSVAISVYCITLKLNLAVSCDSLIYFSIETLAAFALKERIQFAKMAYKMLKEGEIPVVPECLRRNGRSGFSICAITRPRCNQIR